MSFVIGDFSCCDYLLIAPHRFLQVWEIDYPLHIALLELLLYLLLNFPSEWYQSSLVKGLFDLFE